MAAALNMTGIEGGNVAVAESDLAALANDLAGPILRPGDGNWDEAVLIWNGMVAKTPALVVRPTSAADVATVVRFAADHGILLSIKGGGHNIAGTSMAPGGLTLDMSLLRQVDVDPNGRRARVGAGCLLQHVDAATQEHGLAAVLGFVSETGVAGLTLGGGIGYLSRRFGWTVDTLEEVEIVTASGDVLTANRDENSELFWALRGGGGNFGVATRFNFQLFDVGPMITGGLILWSGEHAADVLEAYREVTDAAPRELTTVVTVRLAPPAPFIPPEWHGKPIAGMIVCHTGRNPEGDLGPIRQLPTPIVDLIMEKPYTAQQSMLDATQPKGNHYYWKTEFIPSLSDGYLAALRENGLEVTSPLSQSVAFHLGGAVNERDPDDGAVGNRDAQWFTAIASAWPPSDPRGDEHVAWTRRSWEAIRPFASGNYVNFQFGDEGADRIAAAYGPNLERLERVKAEYDPGNLFRTNRNVSPAAK